MNTIFGNRQFNVGVVLSGGAARGYAHLGLLKALNEFGVYPDIISGTSAGAIAGALYADGHTPEDIFDILATNSRLDFLRLAVPKDGLLRMSGMIRVLREAFRAQKFEDLEIPLVVAATDLNNARIEYFSSGELLRPVIASASIPVIFKPTVINNIYYVDGGVMDNLPISPIEDKCRLIIGSYVNSLGFGNNFNTLMGIAERSFHLSVTKDLANKQKKFDLFINPPELSEYNAFDQPKAREIFEIGYNTAGAALKEFVKQHPAAAKGH
jgi:NTE family protein